MSEQVIDVSEEEIKPVEWNGVSNMNVFDVATQKKSKKTLISVIVGVILIALMLLTMKSLEVDGDTMWHIKTGEWIYKHQAIPTEDVFSWQEGLSWFPHETGYDFLLYLLYSVADLLGVRLLGLVLAISAYIACTYYNYKQKNIEGFGVTYWLWSIPLIYAIMEVSRPGEVSLLVAVINLIVYIGGTRPKWFWTVFPISALLIGWMHGGYLLTLFFQMAVLLFSDFVMFLKKRQDGDIEGVHHYKNYMRNKAILLVIGALAGCCNPLGYKIYTYYFVQSQSDMFTYISEWQPYTISSLPLGFMLILALVTLSFSDIKNFNYVDLQSGLILAFWTLFTFKYVRGQYMLYVVMILLAYKNVNNFLKLVFDLLLGKWFPKDRIKSTIEEVLAYVVSGLPVVLFLIEFAYGSYSTIMKYDVASEKELYDNITMPNYSYGCIEYLKENNINSHIFNDYNVGGYFIFNDIPTFVDSRCDPFIKELSTVDTFKDEYTYVREETQDIENGWLQLVEKYDLEYIVIMPYADYMSAYIHFLDESDSFELVYEDTSEVVNQGTFDAVLDENAEMDNADWYSKGYIYKVVTEKE